MRPRGLVRVPAFTASTGEPIESSWRAEQQNGRGGVFSYMESNSRAAGPAVGITGWQGDDRATAEARVTALYQAHALGLIRLAHIMLGSRQSAEDVVQDAFCGLYRRWDHLADRRKALAYLRSSVLNGCRSVLRRHPPRARS